VGGGDQETGEALDAASDEARLIDDLRGGDECAFARLVDQHGSAMLRVAASYVKSRTVAEEVVQDTWLAVLNGLERFEGRSSLRTWIFRILTNAAKTRAEREGRIVSFSDIASATRNAEPALELERFLDASHGGPAGWWVAPLRRWPDDGPAERLFARETRARISRAIGALAPAQRIVITLRDVEGWSADEVCEALEISDENQRVLLNRARARVRRSLEQHLDASKGSA